MEALHGVASNAAELPTSAREWHPFPSWPFDVMSVRGSSRKYLGVVAIVSDTMSMSPLPRTVVLDATDAVDDLFDTSNPARLTLVAREGNGSFLLQTQDMDIRLVSRL